MSFLRQMFSGDVTPEDPRRFVVQAMLGAMAADGDVQDEEMAVLQKNLDEHELFAGLTGDAATRLLDLATDAVKATDGDTARLVTAIAAGIPGRSHRLAAYAMACEICVSDREMAEGEISYLESLQREFSLDDDNAKEIFNAVRTRAGLLTLREKTERMRQILPLFVQCMALMAVADDEVHPEELDGVRSVLMHIPDMAVFTPDELEQVIQSAFGELTGADPAEKLRAIAAGIDLPADRYWTTVYMMIIALADGHQDWREVVFLSRVQDVFGLTEEQMDSAMSTAELFPAAPLGGAPPEQSDT